VRIFLDHMGQGVRRDYYEQKCATLDRQIGCLVYDLYGLTEGEIRIVEGTAP